MSGRTTRQPSKPLKRWESRWQGYQRAAVATPQCVADRPRLPWVAGGRHQPRTGAMVIHLQRRILKQRTGMAGTGMRVTAIRPLAMAAAILVIEVLLSWPSFGRLSLAADVIAKACSAELVTVVKCVGNVLRVKSPESFPAAVLGSENNN